MGREWAYECPDCGRIGQHAKTCGMFPLGIVDVGNRVEVVRAADHAGAVDRADAAEKLLREIRDGKHSIPGVLVQIDRLLPRGQ
jgi:hypothetical protein